MKLKAIIVLEEQWGKEAVQEHLQKEFNHYFEKVVTLSDLQAASKLLASEKFDLCFFDITDNIHWGIELLPFLPKDTKLIILKKNIEDLNRLLRDRAFACLKWSEWVHDFKERMLEIEEEYFHLQKPRFLIIKEQGASIPIKWEDIEYLKAKGPYSTIYCINSREFITAKTLKTLADQLGDDFIRIHKSYLVNKKVIKSFKLGLLTTLHNTTLPVSRLGAKVLAKRFKV